MDENYGKLLDNAYNLHVSGKFEEAKIAYEKLIEKNPEDINLLNLYAQLNFSLRNYDISLKLFYQIYEKTKLDEIKVNIAKIHLQQKEYQKSLDIINTIQNKNADILRLEAQAHLALQNIDGAISAYEKLFLCEEILISDIVNLSAIYLNKEDYENSLKYALEAYNYAPSDVNLLLHISFIYSKFGNTEKEIEFLEKALQFHQNPELLYNLGVLYRQINNYDKAIENFNKVLSINPEHKLAQLNLARIYQSYDKNVSIQIYKSLMNKYPEDTMILSQLYIIYKDMLKYDLACEIAQKIIQTAPKEDFGYSYAGDALFALGRFQEAIEMYEEARKYSDNTEYSDTMIADIYSVTGQGDKAIEIFKTKYPNLTKTSPNYAFIQLKERNLDEARDAMYAHLTAIYTKEELDERAIKMFYKFNLDKRFGVNEAEFKKYRTDKNQIKYERYTHYIERSFYKKEITNKRLLIFHDRGLGDVIMFIRYLKFLSEYTDKIILQVPKSLRRLIEFNYPEYKVVLDDYTVSEKEYDYTSSFFNLLCTAPKVDLREIPYSSGYLNISDDLIKEKSKLEIMNTKKRKIGIFWQGNPNLLAQRSIKLEELKPLFEIENTQYYSFQISDIDHESNELKKQLPLIDLSEYIKDFADTAAFLKNIDLLVTIDTSIANLAGAMGIKTYMLLPYDSEWRWFYDTDKTAWYNSIKIFKQTTALSWKDVVERLKDELTI